MENELLALTADIVSAHVGNNTVAAADVAGLISTTYAALLATTKPVVAEPVKADPAVPIRSSIKHDYIVCLEDGAKLKMLKRYLMTNFSLSPEEYRAKWGLPRDYPMVAPAYAEQRRELANKIGLGRKKSNAPTSKIVKAKAPAGKRGRPVKTKAEAPATDEAVEA